MNRRSSGIRVRILGAATVVPGADQDTACVLLDGRILVDTGWNSAVNMLHYGEDPMQVDWLFITHCHHDHYLGLPQLLFYHAMRRRRRADKPPLTIIGPKPDIALTVERAVDFLQHDRFPDVPGVLPAVVPLQAGAEYEAGGLRVRTAPTVHPVVGLCYRFTEPTTGASVALTGDTAYHEPLARHVAGADLLIHEASHGPVAVSPLAYGGHSGAVDAARIAAAAEVKRLVLVHYPRDRAEESLAAAREVFPETVLGVEGDVYELA
ncbi:MAG: MBL fold metallo-hydrolase [Kiritimatiellaeota bacterium]|nr:MBL fold metallo-hydrolase [Kiritimatiellota bacterium]